MNSIGKLTTRKKICFTQNLFGSISDIENKSMEILEQNRSGDCLCVFNNNLIDVDSRDIESSVMYKKINPISVLEQIIKSYKE